MIPARTQILDYMARRPELIYTRAMLLEAIDAKEGAIDVALVAARTAGQIVRIQPGRYKLANGQDTAEEETEPPPEDSSLSGDDDADLPALELAYWADGDLVLRRGEGGVHLILSRDETQTLVNFLARTGHCRAIREDLLT